MSLVRGIILLLTAVLASCSVPPTAPIIVTRDARTATPTLDLLEEDERPPSQPLAGYLRRVEPPPGEIVPMAIFTSFDEENNLPIGMTSRASGYDSSVCVDIILRHLVHPGDDLTELEDVAERITIEVDDALLSEQTRGFQAQSLYSRFGEEGTPIATWAGPTAGFCWHANLGPGVHVAQFTFRASDGAIYRYEWHFALTE